MVHDDLKFICKKVNHWPLFYTEKCNLKNGVFFVQLGRWVLPARSELFQNLINIEKQKGSALPIKIDQTKFSKIIVQVNYFFKVLFRKYLFFLEILWLYLWGKDGIKNKWYYTDDYFSWSGRIEIFMSQWGRWWNFFWKIFLAVFLVNKFFFWISSSQFWRVFLTIFRWFGKINLFCFYIFGFSSFVI